MMDVVRLSNSARIPPLRQKVKRPLTISWPPCQRRMSSALLWHMHLTEPVWSMAINCSEVPTLIKRVPWMIIFVFSVSILSRRNYRMSSMYTAGMSLSKPSWTQDICPGIWFCLATQYSTPMPCIWLRSTASMHRIMRICTLPRCGSSTLRSFRCTRAPLSLRWKTIWIPSKASKLWMSTRSSSCPE